jgi:lipoyl(octanoyl) transferase
LVDRRFDGVVPDLLWLLEHAPTMTFGSKGGEAHLRVPREDLERLGYSVHGTRRGGDVTCHEPGQLVGYPVIALQEAERDLHVYLRRLEAGLIASLATWGLQTDRIDGRAGVWLGSPSRARKIAAIGVHCSRWVTSHGFALNVENDLRGFQYIIPCGISDAGVTSLRDELPPLRRPSWGEVVDVVHRELERALERPLVLVIGDEIDGYLAARSTAPARSESERQSGPVP